MDYIKIIGDGGDILYLKRDMISAISKCKSKMHWVPTNCRNGPNKESRPNTSVVCNGVTHSVELELRDFIHETEIFKEF